MYIIRSSFDWLQVDLSQFSPVASDPQDIREFVEKAVLCCARTQSKVFWTSDEGIGIG